MKYLHALLILGLSLLLLVFVTVDFFQVKNLNKEATRTQQKTDLVDKVEEIGSVLAGCSPCFKFYLKDATDGKYLFGASATMVTREPFNFSSYDFTVPKESVAIYNTVTDGSLNPGYSLPATIQVKISKNGYITKTTAITTTDQPPSTVFLTRIAATAPPPTAPIETIKDIKLPAEFSQTGGSTNLTAIADPAKVENLILDTDANTIKFNEALDLSATETKDKFKDLATYVKADQKGIVTVDSKNLPVLNKKATITMKALSFLKTPKILVDGKENKAVVSNIVYKDGTLTFDVTNFSTFTAVPTVEIKEPVANFETRDKKVTLKGTVSDPTASVSAKLNQKDLGKLKVATDSGEFSKEVDLEEGKNNFIVSALATNLATASATVSGTLLKSVNLTFVYLLLLLLAAIAVYGVMQAIKRMRKSKIGKLINTPTPSTPETP